MTPTMTRSQAEQERDLRGRQRRLNRELADLRKQRGGDDAVITGNGRSKVEGGVQHTYPRRYYGDGAEAGTAYNRNPWLDTYWRAGQGRSGPRLWHVLTGQGG